MEAPDGAELCFPQLFNNSCRKPMPPQADRILVLILLSFISLLTAALNLLVIISISHFRQLHSPTNLLLLSLAVSDFLVGLVLMPGQILLTEACWFLGDLMCALYYLFDFIITTSSVGNIVLISIDRYLAICDPLRYTTRVTLDRTIICVSVFWIYCILYSSFILKDILRQPDFHYSCYGECVIVHNFITGAVDLVFTIIGPITLIVVLYIRVFVVAVSQAQAMRSNHAAVTPHSLTVKKSELKAARTLGVVVVVFLICLCPLYCSDFEGQNTSVILETWLFYFNSCLNPVIYAIFYPWFRKSIELIVTFKIIQPNSCNTKIL